MKSLEFRKKYGEGTDFDLDYGKLISRTCVYIAIQVSQMFGKKDNSPLGSDG